MKYRAQKIHHGVLLLITVFTLSVAVADSHRDIYGVSAKRNGQFVTIDKSFVKRLSERPTLDEWNKNKWELVYLINVGDISAVNTGIDVLANADPEKAKHDDDELVRPLARALSQKPLLWALLSKKPQDTKNRVTQYFDIIPEDYTGYDKADYEWRKQQLYSKPAK
jgi:hypothetical protein